jgi:hypothetical protein
MSVSGGAKFERMRFFQRIELNYEVLPFNSDRFSSFCFASVTPTHGYGSQPYCSTQIQ